MIDLSRDQLNFLALHVKRLVFMWQWHFRDVILRASSGRRSIAIRRDEFEDLIARGLMTKGLGSAVYPTADGKDLIVKWEAWIAAEEAKLIPNRLHGAVINAEGDAI